MNRRKSTKRVRMVGFRVVRTQGLSDDWITAIQLAGLRPANYATINTDLDNKMQSVHQFVSGQQLTDKARAIAALYQVIASYQNEDKFPTGAVVRTAKNKLVPVSDEIKNLPGDPYFAYLGDILTKSD